MKFNWDNKVFQALGKMVDCIALSAMWLVCCLPIITFGASTSALYYAVHKSVRGNRGYMTKNFFHALTKGFKQSTLSWLVLLVVQIVLGMDTYITYQTLKTGNTMGAFFYFFLIMILFSIIWACYLFPYAARFEDGVKATLNNSLLMMIIHLPWSLLVLLLFAVTVFVIYLFPILIFLIPALLFVTYDAIFERIFRKYMSPEDLEKEKENDLVDRMDD